MNLFILSIPLGISLGFLFPYQGLEYSKYSYVLLILMMFFNFLKIEFKFKELFKINLKDLYALFYSFIFMPIFLFFLSTLLKLDSYLSFSIFLINLAPFAIIANQFLDDMPSKKNSIKLIILSTLLFPFYFMLMLMLFFKGKLVFNQNIIFIDSIILVFVPFILLTLLNYFNIDRLKKVLPVTQINYLILGLLSFIFTGSSYLKNDITNIEFKTLALVFAFSLLQDFIPYLISRFLNLEEHHRITLSLKNVALVGTFSVLFFPKTIISIVFVLIAHFTFFIFMEFKSRNKKASQFERP